MWHSEPFHDHEIVPPTLSWPVRYASVLSHNTYESYVCRAKCRVCGTVKSELGQWIRLRSCLFCEGRNQRFETLIQNADPKRPSREYCSCFPREEDDFVSMHCALFEAIVRAQVNRKGVYMTSFKRGYMWFCVHASTRISVFALTTIVNAHFWAAFMLILRRQNQRFETLIQNADPKRPSREYCSCFPREEDDFVSMHCALFEAIVRAQVNRKGVYMTSFKRGYMWFCVHASTRISVLL